MSRDYGQTCFVDMPFGKKTDPGTGLEIDFDQIYAKAIRPAVETAGLQCIRGDKEDSGGIIHKAMFARLLLCDFVVADLTTANANVFYELGVRHAARPYTTIPIYAPLSDLPFDVAMVRTIPYKLIGAGSTAKRKTGRKAKRTAKLTPAAVRDLKKAIVDRIEAAHRAPVKHDSPLFQLFPGKIPTMELSHEVTGLFQEYVQATDELQDKLDDALAESSQTDRLAKVRSIQGEITDSSGALALNQVRFYVNKAEKPVVQVVRQESRTPNERLFR